MIMNALIVGLVLMFTKFFDWWGNTMFQRPIICVAVLGALLGHPKEGIILAAQLELVFLGNVSLGGVMPSDFTLGSIFGAAFALLLGKDLATAVTLALPLAALGTLLYSSMKIAVTSLVPRFEKLLEERNIKGFKKLWILQFSVFHLCYFLLGFICIWAGTDAVKAFVDIIPAWVQKSMTVASTMLPALGMALLLKSLWTKEICPYYFLGFGLGAFFFYNNVTGAALADNAVKLTSAPTKMLSLVQISFIGAAVAALIIFRELQKIKDERRLQSVSSSAIIDESEDFFND
ncbi:PTS mannose/fructose/sorbose/N-acetylgalactosamine transporter subunit IIC [Lacrimispora sp.]|jgi:mannose/fructose/N-acetylgalactosamine-specific phosphotransferase system component IIC|uniref:PTS mannose/fructose/sorbose/N-acetylgalactosamine transporter subunit IIC n=1 Tax=Lacrimispora sp. TaxID=2719234 RepID=UPI0028B1EAA2|nr:PTS sugar transporter subunit IIC [Lacrimispora sp.]